jgi:hypothetical protein
MAAREGTWARTALAVAHQKVVGLDVPVNKVFRVQKLDPGNLSTMAHTEGEKERDSV